LQFLLYDYNYSTKSISYLNFFINKFSKFKVLYLLLLLSLSGLPPFFLFLVKTNILISILNKSNILDICFIFIIFFLNMLFYVQIFYNKNINYSIKIENNKKNVKNINFKLYYSIIFLLIFLIFSVFFFIDIFFILKLIYKCQH